MERAGLWGPGAPFASHAQFCRSMDKGGLGAMELLASELKRRGCYIARAVSFRGASFDTDTAALPDGYEAMYDACCGLWSAAKVLWSKAIRAAEEAPKLHWGLFWSAHQLFFKQLCIAAKVPALVALVNRRLAEGCVSAA